MRRHPWRTLLIPPALLLLYTLALVPFTPAVNDIRKLRNEAPALVMSADGKQLAAFKRANREWVGLAQISPTVIAALIATEDHRFYQHHGMDLRRTASAVLHTLGGDPQGGSTITQQLARNLYPEDIGRARTVTRKLKEAITALKIESVYTKDEILETYLNTVPFLYNAYGIEMAARTYFDKPARRLDLLESATLIGMLKGTSYYNPVLNPERAVQRRNIVLGQMVKHGKLEAARLEGLKKRPMRLDFERQLEPLGPAPHFAQVLKRWLIDWADRNGYDIHADGLVVRTTIDSRLQAAANQAVARQMERLQATADAQWSPRAWAGRRELVQALVRDTAPYRQAIAQGMDEEEALRRVLADAALMQALREEKTRLAAGFLALDPRSGQVRAWVGSRDFALDQFDHVQQARRQPGSTFKPFVYGAAFEMGARPSDTLVDQAVEIRLPGGQVWRPGDATPPTGEVLTLSRGLALSKNTITAQLMQRVGPERVVALAQSLGVRQSKLEQVPSLALGTSPVTLKEMVAAYGAIANGGQYLEPVMVASVEDRDGRVLEAFQPAMPEPAMSLPAAQMLVAAMRGVIDEGTGTAIRGRFGIQADVAGKTGTTQDNTDGWFILVHPQLVAGAWAGFNDSRITMGDSWGQGARSALPMVGDFFQQALRARWVDPQARFTTPAEGGLLDPLLGRINDWLGSIFPQVQREGRRAPQRPPPPAEEMALPPAQAPIPAVVAPRPAPPERDLPPVVTIPVPPPRPPAPVVVAPAPPPGAVPRARVAQPGERPPSEAGRGAPPPARAPSPGVPILSVE
ncbi:candidate bifunctional family GT51 b-glycosyltransferase/PBP transpeptidase (candidate murein polymerase), Glycosyltransferase Family 51 [Ramlibacter tataouinensis TTB310]|uniref:Candidate bifunctional family GT51 b-glycosyltransferase/PBP transpeptidase (Candidate murein polymerase), Glycosyltransferase Family 51 n=1 Tax=Ramlibacter tataouinensis (strain ATCC BAA-407 / DSM 14655 / LMG 21543 / TTB310) TaxID=365046 RepID=F5Y6B5_RAMTT|nr:transglycosylase domain-containing protein [Ramlibacter tataouinensis]AEG92801.1 candidate bifunctional family GT51 b-glycosyltransferase/PBP transpeptidase (candidate murein polymerase), Glycosyltransferase Family 51 [Ramlibacter tataouinensis TTB310]